METVVLVAAFSIAVLCGFLLLFWMIRALRGKRSSVGRVVATIVGMFWAVWQVYVLNPAAGINLTYILAPIAFVNALLILSWGAKDAMSEPPSEGPDVKFPAMAMRQQPVELAHESEEDEQRKTAVGE
jgi:hypothetical protein